MVIRTLKGLDNLKLPAKFTRISRGSGSSNHTALFSDRGRALGDSPSDDVHGF